MAFGLTRIAVWFAQPSNLLLLLSILATALAWTRYQRAARVLLSTVVILAGLPLVLHIADPLIAALERRYIAGPDLPNFVTGIIVLGGGVDTASTARWGLPALNDGTERLTTAAELARAHPEATVVLSGGSAKLHPDAVGDSEVARMFLERAGVAANRLPFEDHSRTAVENATLSFQMVRASQGGAYVLVTSAAHMPRAALAFEHVGGTVVPYPVDFRSSGPRKLPEGLHDTVEMWARLDYALREQSSFLAFRLAGSV